mmetsp:Transcript_3332/g.5031  ORF Transcript_3332/g.5031 Transcript_3332/m.5031 type:complete len:441 (+) Transcript_3332:120-1442(+)
MNALPRLTAKTILWGLAIGLVCFSIMSIHSANLILQGPSRTSEINAEDDDSFFQAPANANVSVNLTTTSSVSLTTTTHWNSTDRLSTPGIYFCYPEDGNGYRDIKKVMASILPEHELRDVSKLGQNKLIRRQDPKYLIADYTNEYDVFLIGRKSTACSAQMSDWLLENFNGHFVFFSGETEWAHPVAGARVDRSRYHFFGSQHSFQAMRSTDLMLTFMQMVWWGVFIERLSPQMMVDPSQRPRGRIEPEHTRPSNYMIYGHGNCVNFREAAAGLLSEFGIVHCDGRCQGATPPSGNRTNLVKTNHDVSIANWEKNIDTYSEYRFCLVLEHSIGHETYISEKILMAFIGGCIPIYYGPELIFDIFNRKAFLFYNISDPQPALDQIKLLENDETLYSAMTKEPIVANGNATIEKYFSFNDTIGKGSLKRRFREKLGVENLVP